MESTKIERELEQLRRQVEELVAKETTPDDTVDQPSSVGATDEEADLSLLRDKLDDFMKLLNQDLQQIPATTAVGIFALGVLTGRLLPR